MEEDDDHADADADEEASPEDEDDDVEMEGEESEEENGRKKRRRSRSKPATTTKDRTTDGPRRTSSRATKFQRSMAEPDGVKEFLEKIPEKKASKGNNSASRGNKKDGGSLANLHLSPEHKSPARRHARHRLSIRSGVDSEDDESQPSDSETEHSGSDEEPLKIQRILACRTETLARWKEICSKIQTSEVDFGSRWFQPENLAKSEGNEKFEERFLVKWSDLSYLHCSWETEDDLLDQVDNGKSYIQTFFRKSHGGVLFSADERCDGDYYNPAFTEVERIMEVVLPEGSKVDGTTADEEDGWTKDDFGMIHDKNDPNFEEGTGRQFLVKWAGIPYSDSTYEFERDLILNDIEYKEPLKSFLRWSKRRTKKEARSAARSSEEERRRMYKVFGSSSAIAEEDQEKAVEKFQKELQDQVYKNGGQVRDYQAEGISWMLSNYVNGRSSILADEVSRS